MCGAAGTGHTLGGHLARPGPATRLQEDHLPGVPARSPHPGVARGLAGRSRPGEEVPHLLVGEEDSRCPGAAVITMRWCNIVASVDLLP